MMIFRLFGGSLLLHQLFHQLLFLDEECSYNSVFDAICATRATICTCYRLLVLGEASIFARTKSGNLQISHCTFKPLRQKTAYHNHCQRARKLVERGQERKVWRVGGSTPGSLMPQSPHLGPLPGFLICRYLSFPPGVLITRVRFERVLSRKNVSDILNGWKYKVVDDGK
jgi:hypothetical protein